MKPDVFSLCLCALLLIETYLANGSDDTINRAQVMGAKVELVHYQGPAAISVKAVEKHRLRIDVAPGAERDAMALRIELAVSGRDAWPAADVEVLGKDGRVMPVLRSGIEWHRLLLKIPAEPETYIVHVPDPTAGHTQPLREKQRHVVDTQTGLTACITQWFHARQAALSIRFDDSHSTHLSKAIPILRKYGFKGTFMVNPGSPDGQSPNPRWRSAFQDHLSEWEAAAQSGDHEFANHTLHHRGAKNDTEMEHQIGDASKVIWALFPGKSKLIALNLGGGTKWETTKPLRYYLDKYHLFDASTGSLGMDDVYGNRVSAFRQHLERNIESQRWCQIHFHSIGNGCASSEEHFRAALNIANEHESELWIAGMADIHKYKMERRRARLAVADSSPNGIELALSCSTDPELYDQSLTIQIALPPDWSPEETTIEPMDSDAVSPTVTASEDRTLCFDVPPVTATYAVKRKTHGVQP